MKNESCSLIWLHYLSETIYFLEAQKFVVYNFCFLFSVLSTVFPCYCCCDFRFSPPTNQPKKTQINAICRFVFPSLVHILHLADKEQDLFYLCKYAWSIIVNLCKRCEFEWRSSLIYLFTILRFYTYNFVEASKISNYFKTERKWIACERSLSENTMQCASERF